jgi:hypothetical protein
LSPFAPAAERIASRVTTVPAGAGRVAAPARAVVRLSVGYRLREDGSVGGAFNLTAGISEMAEPEPGKPLQIPEDAAQWEPFPVPFDFEFTIGDLGEAGGERVEVSWFKERHYPREVTWSLRREGLSYGRTLTCAAPQVEAADVTPQLEALDARTTIATSQAPGKESEPPNVVETELRNSVRNAVGMLMVTLASDAAKPRDGATTARLWLDGTVATRCLAPTRELLERLHGYCKENPETSPQSFLSQLKAGVPDNLDNLEVMLRDAAEVKDARASLARNGADPAAVTAAQAAARRAYCEVPLAGIIAGFGAAGCKASR